MSESASKRGKKSRPADEGTVWAWGDNSRGQLLDVPPCDEPLAPRVIEKHLATPLRGGWDALRSASDETCEEASQGEDHWLELIEGGRVRGAGRTQEGQLGLVQRERVEVPVAIGVAHRVTSVACGGRHSALVVEGGLLFTFGCNGFGQLGHSAGLVVVPQPAVVGVLWPVSVTQVALGAQHTVCLTLTGRVFAFGCNTAGQCGEGRDEWVLAAVEQVPLPSPAAMVACGSEHTLLLLRGSGEVRQWGNGAPPPPPAGLGRVTHVAAGKSHSAAVLEGGGVVCWGDNARGAVQQPPPRALRVSRVVCGNNWTAAYTPARLAAPTPSTPLLGTPSSGPAGGFNSLEQLEQAGLANLRIATSTLRALGPLVARALEYGDDNSRERHVLGCAVLRVGGTAATAAELEQVASLLHDCESVGELEDGAARLWTQLAQTAVSEQLQRTRTMSRAHTLPLLHLLKLLRSSGSAAGAAAAAPARFYNELVSRRLDVPLDYERWTRGLPSMCGDFPWLLQPYAKAAVLQEEARITMDQMYADAVVREMLGRAPSSPFLEMVVRREHLISDTLERLAELETRGSARAFRKRLKVTFEGEQGLDEGGVTKEYFLLLVRQLFKPEYALVTWDENKTLCWFSPAALENESEFKLVGIVFGLAIYNSTILDVHFPPVIYSYLLDPEYQPTFEDLQAAFPALAAGLQQLLDYPGEDIEDVFCLSFAVSSENFGCVTTHELIENGAAVAVTKANRQQYVQLYTRYILLDSVATSLKAFIGGFSLLAKRDGFLQHLLPQELERIVCGYPHWNLAELQRVTTYEGGYAADTPVIGWFWEAVAAMSTADQHKLLSFATGSDRVPVGGFSEMEFVIQRQGEDSEALPTSHTCFNVLLLPEYSSPDKLRQKLEFAIQQTEGFMLL